MVIAEKKRSQQALPAGAPSRRSQQARPAVRPHLAAPIVWLEQAVKDLDVELDASWRASPLWRERDRLRRRVPGVGPTVSLPRLAHLPELGSGSLKHVATLVGRAPLKRDRGAWRGEPHDLGWPAAGAGSGRCGQRSPGPHWLGYATTQSCTPSMKGCWPAARRSP
jgi:hypothetical protein